MRHPFTQLPRLDDGIELNIMDARFDLHAVEAPLLLIAGVVERKQPHDQGQETEEIADEVDEACRGRPRSPPEQDDRNNRAPQRGLADVPKQ